MLIVSKMDMSVLTVLILLVRIIQTVSTDKSAEIVRQTGGSFTLEFQQHQQLEKESIDIIQWYYGLGKIMKYVPFKGTEIFTHEDRVNFNKTTFSLELKNLQKNDSGLYRGEISAGQTDIKAVYRLSVQDPVEVPVLSVVSNWSYSGNVTVTCRGRDLSLTSNCISSTCSPEKRVSNDSTLTLSVSSCVVICNYSNLVSWSTVTLETKQQCHSDVQMSVSIAVLVSVLLFAVAVAVTGAAAHIKRHRRAGGTVATQSEYAEVTPSSALGVSDTGGSTYSTVQDALQDAPAAAKENCYHKTSSLGTTESPAASISCSTQNLCHYATVRRV